MTGLAGDILVFTECVLSVLVIFFVVLQKSAEVEPMISNSSKSSVNRGDQFLVSLVRILIFLFFVNTISLAFINYKNKKQQQVSIVK